MHMSIRSFIIFYLLYCFVFININTAQTSHFPYETTKKGKESLLLGAGLLTTSATFLLDKKIPTLSLDQINRLNINQIPSFDRYSTRFYSERAHQVSNYSGLASAVFPMVILWKEHDQGHNGKLLLIGVEGALLTAGLTNLTKMLSKRAHPYVYNDAVTLEKKMDTNARYSFFSGHTSLSAYFTFSGAQMYSDLYPNSNKKGLVWATAAAIPLVTAVGRMRAGKHFPTDVIVGYAVGAALGVLVPKIHRF